MKLGFRVSEKLPRQLLDLRDPVVYVLHSDWAELGVPEDSLAILRAPVILHVRLVPKLQDLRRGEGMAQVAGFAFPTILGVANPSRTAGAFGKRVVAFLASRYKLFAPGSAWAQ